MKMKLLMILITLLIGLKILTGEQIELIKLEAWKKLTDTEQFNLCNDLIKLCNKTFFNYIEVKKQNESLIKKIDSLNKKVNILELNTLFLIDLKLNIYFLLDFSYQRKILPFFQIGGGFVGGFGKNIYNINEETFFIGGINLKVAFNF